MNFWLFYWSSSVGQSQGFKTCDLQEPTTDYIQDFSKLTSAVLTVKRVKVKKMNTGFDP